MKKICFVFQFDLLFLWKKRYCCHLMFSNFSYYKMLPWGVTLVFYYSYSIKQNVFKSNIFKLQKVTIPWENKKISLKFEPLGIIVQNNFDLNAFKSLLLLLKKFFINGHKIGWDFFWQPYRRQTIFWPFPFFCIFPSAVWRINVKIQKKHLHPLCIIWVGLKGMTMESPSAYSFNWFL